MNLFRTKTKQDYPAVVQEIHNEFETASDVLVKECEEFLRTVSKPDMEKASRLEKLGFKQVREVVETKSIASELSQKEEIRDLVGYYKRHYPNNKFITQEQVRAICEKYDLVQGDVSRYTGFVPEVKLRQIEVFKLRKEDQENVYSYGYQKKTATEWFKINSRGFVELHILDKSNIVGKGAAPLEICAPLKDMDTSGMRVEDRRLVREIPDPVVLQPVRGGYLILAAWGDEASDEIVVNQGMN